MIRRRQRRHLMPISGIMEEEQLDFLRYLLQIPVVELRELAWVADNG